MRRRPRFERSDVARRPRSRQPTVEILRRRRRFGDEVVADRRCPIAEIRSGGGGCDDGDVDGGGGGVGRVGGGDGGGRRGGGGGAHWYAVRRRLPVLPHLVVQRAEVVDLRYLATIDRVDDVGQLEQPFTADVDQLRGAGNALRVSRDDLEYLAPKLVKQIYIVDIVSDCLTENSCLTIHVSERH